MRIAIPYNEILPTGKAHDAFLFREAAELALAGCAVDLLVGKGSLDNAALQAYYGTSANLQIRYLPIIRKNNPFNLSWNRPFFTATASYLKKNVPDVVLLSVLKQAADLLQKRQAHVKYIYEAHELAYYPGLCPKRHFDVEKQMLEKVDLISVTTSQLKEILLAPPYNIRTPIVVIPLAVDAMPLPPPPTHLPPTVTYVGQLYKEQGIAELLEAMREVPEVCLRVIGGTAAEIARLNPHLPNVRFEGFIAPSLLQEVAINSHAFIAPFQLVGRMPYVAHTKLYSYRAWGRPVIAPASAIVEEHLPDAWTYHDPSTLIEVLRKVPQAPLTAPHTAPWSARIAQLLKNL